MFKIRALPIVLKSISIAILLIVCLYCYMAYYSQPENAEQLWLESEGPIDPELETVVLSQLFEAPPPGVALETIWIRVPEWKFIPADSSDGYIKMRVEISGSHSKDDILQNFRHSGYDESDTILSESGGMIEFLCYRRFIPNNIEEWTQYFCFSSNHIVKHKPDVFPLEAVLIPGFMLCCALLFLPYRKIIKKKEVHLF